MTISSSSLIHNNVEPMPEHFVLFCDCELNRNRSRRTRARVAQKLHEVIESVIPSQNEVG